MKKSNKKLLAMLALSALFAGYANLPAQAANFSEASMRLDRMKVSITDNQILVVVKPTTNATEAAAKVIFAAGFGVDADEANITVSTAGLPATYQGESLTAMPGVGTAATAVSGQTVSFAAGNLNVGTLYGFYITGGIDNPGVAGQYRNTISTENGSGSTIDRTQIATRIIADDQIVITAKVPPLFNFQLDGNTDTFTTDLDSAGVVSTGGRTVTISTNANDGWIAWLKSSNTSLDSANTGETIETVDSVDGTPSTLTPGSDGYVLDVDLTTDSGTGDGTVTVAAEYDGTDTSSGGTLPSTYTEIASGDGTTNGDVLTDRKSVV